MSHDQQQYLHYLIDRYYNNSISAEELDTLWQMMRNDIPADQLSEALVAQWKKAGEKPENTSIDWDTHFTNMIKEAGEQTSPVVPIGSSRKRNRYRIAAAVIALGVLGTAGKYLYNSSVNKTTVNPSTTAQADRPLTPGADGAILTLANGQQIVLDSTGNGVLAMQGNTQVVNRNGSIHYNSGEHAGNEVLYNTLQTPRGKQYQLQLSDGTRVWLNAASSIRFPAVFTGDQRLVSVTGEVYFEVAHGSHSNSTAAPFIVAFNNINGQKGEIQVLGTSFNINAYSDENMVKTTLLDGKIKVALQNGQKALLQPGQQARIDNAGTMDIAHQVDLEAVVAWKNGFFSFNHTDMATLMRQIARWYDVEIEYAGAIPDRHFGGEISRFANGEQVLKIMEESKVRFKQDGKKIIVLP